MALTGESNRPDGSIEKIPSGTLLIKENEISRKMFIIKKGKVRVFKTYLGQRVNLAILGEGEIFGELSFMDAEPRSASVEALTEIEVQIVDGDKASKQMANLPTWVAPIFRSVFHRFREMDQKMTVLQSMNEYQKKIFKKDTMAQTVYLELLRYIKTLKILYARLKAPGAVRTDELLKEMDDILGNRYLGLKVFWRMLKEHDFVDSHLDDAQGLAEIRMTALDAWSDYLNAEAKNERYLFLSHTAVAILRRIVAFTHIADTQTQPASEQTAKVTFEDIKIHGLPLYKEALKELADQKVLFANVDVFTIEPSVLYRLYVYQSVLKAFDHTIVNVD